MVEQTAGMGHQDRAEREKFEGELRRIISASDDAGVILRVIGSLAFQLHCPGHGNLQHALGRSYTDLDFAAYSREAPAVRGLFEGLGYQDNREVFIVSGGERAIFDKADLGLHVDIFFEKLDFCHVIQWNGRLEVDAPTIPLAELLLEKMQIVEINEKDVIDTIMLLIEHPLGDIDHETINIQRVAQLCANDWGLWRTSTMNLGKVRSLAQKYAQLSRDQKARVAQHVQTILERIEAEPKPLAWRLRDRVGDRVKWYKDVDAVQ